MVERTESMRQLVDMAINSGRKRQSPQTGFIHYCYHSQDDETHLTIPLVENFCFALALLRSRTIENVNEAKIILEGLLHFQNRDAEGIAAGNFPIYIHEFPICKDRFIGLNIGAVIYWILKQFHMVLGVELKKRLEDCLTRLLQHAMNTHRDKPGPYPVAIKIACLAIAAGMFLQRDDFEIEGKRQLTLLRAEDNRIDWCCPSTMGAMLAALVMVYPRLSESPWIDFWKHLNVTWHRHTCTYIGPAMKEWQCGEEPQVTLYDLFMGYFQGEFSDRAKRESVVHLEGVLIPANDDSLIDLAYPLQVDWTSGRHSWYLCHDETIAYCFIENPPEINPIYIKGFHPLRIVWGDRRRVHSFVCQGGNVKNIEFVKMPTGVDLIFELGNAVEVEDREKSRETIFFMDVHEGMEMLISGHKSTTFSLGEEICIRSGNCVLSLTFHLQEGDGRFLGHRMLGNRYSQLLTKGKQRYGAYDWQIFMRTIQRSELCVVKASLRITKET